MQLPKRKILLVIVGGLVFSSVLAFCFIPRNKTTSTLLVQDQIRPELPARLKIPVINVDSTVEYVGLTPGGAMDIPKKQGDVAWFKLGQRPGEIGSAVIAGHYGLLKNGTASVFDDLYRLKPGDKGMSISFVVRESRRYDSQADASDVFGSNDGRAHLNLITCEGILDEVSKSYPTRLIVFTDRE